MKKYRSLNDALDGVRKEELRIARTENNNELHHVLSPQPEIYPDVEQK